MSATEYDIIIVGGGPAGASFARIVAQSGMRILLINGQGRDNKKPCGGLLAPDTQRALAEFDLTLPKEILVNPQIFSVKTIDVVKNIVRYYPRFYLNVDRYLFDEWMLSLVPKSIQLINGWCTDVCRKDSGFSVTVKRDGVAETLHTRFLVGADGANSIVRRKFFKTDIMHYVAIQQWFRAEENENPFYSCIFDSETNESCSWSINKDEFFIYGGSFSPQNCLNSFERQKQRLESKCGFRFGEAVKTETCMVFRPRKMHDFQTGRDGIYLIGEAAGFISPSSFEGISSAIISGKYLAEAFCTQNSNREITKAYAHSAMRLKRKLCLKCMKRVFMYNPLLRGIVMRSGLTAINVVRQSITASDYDKGN